MLRQSWGPSAARGGIKKRTFLSRTPRFAEHNIEERGRGEWRPHYILGTMGDYLSRTGMSNSSALSPNRRWPKLFSQTSVRPAAAFASLGKHFTKAEMDNVQKWSAASWTSVQIHAALVKDRKCRRQNSPDLTTVRRFANGKTHKRSAKERRGRKTTSSARATNVRTCGQPRTGGRRC